MTQDDHKHLHELISALADGTLTPEEAAQVQVHMKDCPDCRQLLHDIRRIGTAVGEEAVPPVPPRLAGRIRERITTVPVESLAASPAAPIWRSPFPLAAAATLLLVSVIWLAWPRGAPRSTPLEQDVTRQTPVASQAPPAKQAPPPTTEKAPASAKAFEHPPSAGTEEQLKTLGYLVDGGSNEPNPAGQADSIEHDSEAAKEKSAAPEPGASANPEGGYLDKLTSSGLTGEDYKKAESRRVGNQAPAAKDAGAAAPMAAAPSSASTVTDIRSLVYEGPDYSATFVEDGLITLIARGYACSADVPISKPGASPGARAERADSVEDLLSLFAAAGSKDFINATAPRDGFVKTESSQAVGNTSSLTLRDGQGNSIRSVNFSDPLPENAPKSLRAMRQAIGHLLKDRYRFELETRCGPLTQGILDAP